jgi:subtilisin family serine protease
MRHKRSIVGVLAVLLAWGVAVPSGAATAAPAPVEAQPASTVTLLTGDKVTLGGQHGATVQPAMGREKVGFLQKKDRSGDIHVVPDDLAGMLSARRIDSRLFNVTKLAKHGYDDASRKDIPLIIGKGKNLAPVRAEKATGLRSFTDAERIWLDGPVRATLDKSVPQIGTPEAWKAGHTGKGTTVAVLDTGIDATHPDLDDAVTDAQNFTDATTGPDDHAGHGTHVASIITGDHEQFRGVAPDAKLLNGKVLDDQGFGFESWIIAGMQWAAGQGADVINLSLGSDFPSDGTDPMSQAVNRLTAETGALFVISAGNSGGMIGSPAAADAALTVGAVDHNDQLAPFSNRGPRVGDGAIKPDITAPGVNIVAAKAQDAGHVGKSGTSMAAPHVAGAAAILAGKNPDWRAGQLKATLMGSAKPHPTLSAFEQGAGRVDIARAIDQKVHADPVSISGGFTQWPHHDDVPITKSLTYTNSGTEPVTLNLTTEVRDPAGNPAAAGMFTVSPATLTLPAGGQAQAQVTIDTRVGTSDGIFNGAVKAGEVRTPITVTREVESYNLTLKYVDQNGQPTNQGNASFMGVDNPLWELDAPVGSDTTVLRMPKGRYFFIARVTNGQRWTYTSEPEYVIDGDTTFVMDARDGKPFGFTVDKPNARAGWGMAQFLRETTGGEAFGWWFVLYPNFDGVLLRPSKTEAKQFLYTLWARLAEPDGKGGFLNSPYMYTLVHDVVGKVPAEPHRVRDSELARVRSEHAATAEGRYGRRDDVVVGALPFTLQEFYTPDREWSGTFFQSRTPVFEMTETIEVARAPRVYKLGPVTTERWNYGVFGPAFPQRDSALAIRRGDEMLFSIGLHTGQAHGKDGTAVNDTGSTKLYLNDKVIGSTPRSGNGIFTVPPGEATYRLHTESVTELAVATKTTVDWTFKSGTTTQQTPLPLAAVRFAPTLDSHNRAARSVPTVVPITVDHSTGAKTGPPEVHVSHDEGTTWKLVPVVTIGGKWFTVLVHPQGAKTVSLKASAKDTDGNSVEQTAIRAFLLK